MEGYVTAPDGTVVHLYTGGKTDFKSPGHYRRHRAVVMQMRKAKATDLILPPALAKIPKLASWEHFEAACDAIGAPKG